MNSALAKRAAAVFKWAPGMRTAKGRRISWLHNGGAGGIRDGDNRARPEHSCVFSSDVPDITDPGTIGCMWSQVMECLPAPSPDSEFAMSLNEALFLTSSYGPLDPKVVPHLIAAMEARS